MKITIKMDNKIIKQYDGCKTYKAVTTRDIANDELIINIESYIDDINDEQINFDNLANSDFDIKF